jgi:hypothetical protein
MFKSKFYTIIPTVDKTIKYLVCYLLPRDKHHALRVLPLCFAQIPTFPAGVPGKATTML